MRHILDQITLELTDIYRSAYHLCMGGDLVGIKANKDSRQIMRFLIKGEGLDKLDRKYRTGQALVNPLQLREALNHLRDVLFTKRDEYKNKKGRLNNDRKRNYKSD